MREHGVQRHALLYSEDRHRLFSCKSKDPAAILAARTVALPQPNYRAAGRARSSQAIVVLCSADREASTAEPIGAPGAGVGGGGIALEAPKAADRWCSWADTKPVPREKLVEEQLARTHREYCRLFEQYGGGPRGARGRDQAAAQAPCRACFDPMLENLMNAITTTRRLTGDSERIVFHYMHHHAPSMAALREEGKLLLYCQDSNEHRSLPLQSVHEQLRGPAAYIFDCPHAGRLIRALGGVVGAEEDVVALGTCGEAEALPWVQLGLPVDLFTACLTSPIRTALNFYRARSAPVLADLTQGAHRLVTGRPLSELTSVFTAVADAIAWSSLPQAVFSRLFREDGALAELCRNFLLAGRILHSFGLHASSRPELPATHAHHLWDAWDSTLELFLLRLAQQAPKPCLFFDEQMAAFSVWLRFQAPLDSHELPEPPAELPVMLQGLLHTGCRLQALHLLGCFVDLGTWAVHFTLRVGARPYLTKLLSHDDPDTAPEVAGLALVIWTKILSSDAGKEGLPGKDTHRSFFKLVQSEQLSEYHRALAALCLAVACRHRAALQTGYLQLGLLDLVAKILSTSQHVVLRWMTALLCAEACRGCADVARAALTGRAAEALVSALADRSPEVRASSIYAIGCVLGALPQLAARAEDPDVVAAAGGPPAAPAAEASDPPAPAPAPAPPVPGASLLAALGMGIGAAAAEAAPAPAQPAAGEARWAWLAHAAMWHFCREPPADLQLVQDQTPRFGPSSGGLSANSQALPDCSILNETSMLVRHELICALVPWLSEGSSGQTGGGGAPFASLPPTPNDPEASLVSDLGDEAASVCSTASSGCASTPTLNPARSPHLRPNLSLFAVPVAAAHQAERRFMNLLAQDPVLLSLGGARRVASPLRGSGKAVLLRHRPSSGMAAAGRAMEAARDPLRKVASESCLARLKQGIGAEEDTAEQAPLLESTIYEWTVNYVQQPNVLSRLRDLSPEPSAEPTLDLSQPCLCPSQSRGLGGWAAAAGEGCPPLAPQCPWGVPPLRDGSEDAELDVCRPITLPAKPMAPFLLPPASRRCTSPPTHLRAWSVALSRQSRLDTSNGVTAPPWVLPPARPKSPEAPGRWRPAGGAPPRVEAAAVLGRPTASCSSTCEVCEASAGRGDAAPPPLLAEVLLDELRGGDEPSWRESWGDAAEQALQLHPGLATCFVQGRHGQLSVVSCAGPGRPTVRSFNVQEVERCTSESSASSRDPLWPSSRSGREELASITQTTLINEHGHRNDDPHHCLLCCATDDGGIHICRCWGCDGHKPAVVCAFQALPRRCGGAGLCVHWLQEKAQLVAAGRDPHVRIWDLEREQMLRSLKHNSKHKVTCVTQGCASETDGAWSVAAGLGAGGLVLLGCGDGSLLAVDPRLHAGVVQCHRTELDRVVTITPGVSSPSTRGAYLVASSDSHGLVDLWDVRMQRTQACYQLGVSTLSEPRLGSEFERGRTLCCAGPHGGLIASIRLLPASPQVLTLTDLASSTQRMALTLPRDVQPLALGYHPSWSTLGVLTHSGGRSGRLLLYGHTGSGQD